MEEPSFTGKLKIVSFGFGESGFSETRGETIGSVKKKTMNIISARAKFKSASKP